MLLQQVIYEDLWLSSDKLDWDGEIWILAASKRDAQGDQAMSP